MEKGYSIMFCAEDKPQKLENISVYDSAYDCLYEEGYMPCYETAMEAEEFSHFLRHVDDWESIRPVVINSEIVLFCDSINGDVNGFCSLADFLHEMQEQFEQEQEWEQA